jgi:DNA polymerase III delta prime subunit
MNREDYAVLLSLCETGDVVEVKYGKTRRSKLLTWVFAAANYETKIPKEVLSRFQILRFPQYTEEQFLETAIGVLVRRVKVEESLARYISEKTYSKLGSGDVRQAIRIAKLSNCKGDVDKWVNMFTRYSGE